MKKLPIPSFILVLLLFTVLFPGTVHAQEKQYRMGCVAFYNLENLFDTIDDPRINDEEFLPDGLSQWTSERYHAKLKNMASVISQIGDEFVPGGPVILGVSEIENASVLEDLCATPPLDKGNYKVVHHDGPDRRGVDVGLIYQSGHFTVTASKSVRLRVAGDTSFRTRDQLVVSGLLDGEQLHVIVNHWPSRRGGEKRSAWLREAAAQLSRSIVDSLLKTDPKAKIILMGDLNDNPTDPSVIRFLRAHGSMEMVRPGELFNPMYKMYRQDGLGTTAYKDSWSIFDQIIVSHELTLSDRSSFRFFRAKIFNRPVLEQKEGAFKGYPHRTYAGGVYLGGYSDHFPVYIFLIKEK